MAQTVSWLPLAASSEHRSSELESIATNTQPRPPSSSSSPSSLEFRRWDVNHQLYNPASSSSASSPTREQRMSLDYHPPSGLYTQTTDLDHPSAVVSLADAENLSSPTSPHPLSSSITSNFDHSEGNYDLFANSPQATTFASPRYRNNASSSSSLNHNAYPLSPETIYPPHAPFDSYSSTTTSSAQPSYDMIQSYSSGKVSPLTPSDPHPYTPVSAKEYPQPGYTDLLPDRRTYQTDYHDEYAVNGNGAHPFPTRFQHDPLRYPDAPLHPSGVPPQATTQAYRTDAAMQGYGGGGDMPHYPNHISHHHHHHSRHHPHADLSLRMPPPPPSSVDETLARMKLQSHSGMAGDLLSFIRPHLDQYVRTPNRLAFGERTVIVMSSRVAQKSYGTEKRFLCPPPTAIMIGNSWWSDVIRHGEEPKLCPPRVIISISGEPTAQDGTVDWTSSSGKSFDVSEPPLGTTYIGRCVGKQLFISDVDEKKKKVEALVKITAASSDTEPERTIGTFPSRPIKVISKPSKKRQSAKNLELCINHGSTISLFHRLRSQTVSTKYLCVSGSGSSFKGSDSAPLMGLDHRSRTATPSFIARTASWDPFVMYIVDVSKPAAGLDAPPPPPPHADYPSPPPNAIPFTNNGSAIPIYYNQTVVLQCLTSGVVSPVLIIRKVDHQTIVVGGGLQEGAKNVADQYCPPGEVCGDPVSQLHKVAFEVYDSTRGFAEPGTPGPSGAFLSCMGEKVNTFRPIDGRQWNTSANNGSMSPPGSPVGPTPASSSASLNGEYFGQATAESAPGSPHTPEFPSNDGGRVKKKRSSSSAGGIAKTLPVKGRRRQNSATSTTSSRRGSSSDPGATSGALWQVDIGETSVWTIVGTDQVRYNFYVPPFLFDRQNVPQSSSFPVPSKPVTPFPCVVKYLPSDRAAEAPKANCSASRAVLTKPHPHASKMLTIYGENFSKSEPIHVFFGSEPSPYVEVRCTEVLGCLPPEDRSTKRRPVILVRSDGVVFPSNTLYP